MAAPKKKPATKFTLALRDDLRPWCDYEAARRGVSLTEAINQFAEEARDNAPANVKAAYEAFMATRRGE